MKYLVFFIQAFVVLFALDATAALNATEPPLTSHDFVATSFRDITGGLFAYDEYGQFKAQFGPYAHELVFWCLDADPQEHTIYYGGAPGIYRANIETGAHELFHTIPPGFTAVRIGGKGGVFIAAYEPTALLIARFDRAGQQTQTSTIPVGSAVRDFDISADECTIAYITIAKEVSRYDVCHGMALANMEVPAGATPLTVAFAPNGDLLVAMYTLVARYDPAGNLRRTYTDPASTTPFEQVTFPNTAEFLAGSRTLVRFNLETGDVTGRVTLDTAEYLIDVISVAEATGPPQPVPVASRLTLAILAVLLAGSAVLAIRR